MAERRQEEQLYDEKQRSLVMEVERTREDNEEIQEKITEKSKRLEEAMVRNPTGIIGMASGGNTTTTETAEGGTDQTIQ